MHYVSAGQTSQTLGHAARMSVCIKVADDVHLAIGWGIACAMHDWRLLAPCGAGGEVGSEAALQAPH